MQSEVLNVVDGVEVTREMVNLYAKRFSIDSEANMPGIIGSIGSWISGRGELDAYLTDAPETREAFSTVRNAYFKAQGHTAPEFSKVSFYDVVPREGTTASVEGASARPGVAGQPDPRPLSTERLNQPNEPVRAGYVSQVHADGSALKPEEKSDVKDGEVGFPSPEKGPVPAGQSGEKGSTTAEPPRMGEGLHANKLKK